MKSKNQIYFCNSTRAKISQSWIKKNIAGLLKKYKINDIVEIGIYLVSKKNISQLNRRYRKINKVTDVLSFSQPLALGPKHLVRRLLGDIVICWQLSNEQAKLAGQSPKKELKLLIEHGFRHLIGIHHK